MPHAEAIRFALVGSPVEVNVWSLFDETGASYANYALHSDEYPRLYRLSIPAREFEPYVADGMPSAVAQEGSYLAAGVTLKPDLAWSDGSPLSAGDVAFTINTALAFRLRYDWLSAYNPDLLEHAEAVDNGTVKFYFSRPFNVGDWQYGALQGPVVSREYWSPRVTEASALLPSQELIDSLAATRAEADVLQTRVDADNAQLLTTLPNSETYNELSARVVRNQNELNSVNSRLIELQDEHDAALNAARAALFALEDDGEPTFGPFLRAVQGGELYTRAVNPLYPFEQPNFDRASYRIFGDEESALAAFKNDEVNVMIGTQGRPGFYKSGFHLDHGMRYLAFNPRHPELADPALRLALDRALDYREPDQASEGPLTTDAFVLPNPWMHPSLLDTPLDSRPGRETLLVTAVEILKGAGYTWQREPAGEQAGSGLLMPDGRPFPVLTLLVSSAEPSFAQVIGVRAGYLGIDVTILSEAPETVRYRVYSSRDYDLALLAYRLSEYPGYLCEWFQPPGPFAYGSDRLGSACQTFHATADLETARQAAYEIQSILMEDLPFIPLYETATYVNLRGVIYPFHNVLGGLNGLYGAPSLAIPAP